MSLISLSKRSVTCSGDLFPRLTSEYFHDVKKSVIGTHAECRWEGADSLSSRTPIPPDIPSPHQAVPPPDVPDLGRRDALVVTVVPLADVLRDLDVGRARGVGYIVVSDAVPVPGQRLVLLPDAEELEGALCALPRGDVAAIVSTGVCVTCWGEVTTGVGGSFV